MQKKIKNINPHSIPTFNINFFQFECEDALTNRILNIASSLNFVKNKSNLCTFEDTFFDEELISWFESCIHAAKIEIGLESNNIQIPITSCWVNKTTRVQGHHEHYHPNSFMSGVFYLTSHNHSPTQFFIPNIWIKDFPMFSFPSSVNQNDLFQIFPKKSTLILFPSHVRHFVAGNASQETRYTISFNTFLSGVISEDPFSKMRLELSVKTLRDTNKNET